MSEQGEGTQPTNPDGLHDARPSGTGRHLSWTDKAALVLNRMPSRLIVLVDEQFVIRWVNEFALTVLRRERHDILGRSALEFVHPDDHRSALDEQARMRAEPAQDLEAEQQDTDGRATLRIMAADNVVPVEWRVLNFLADVDLGLIGLEGRVVRAQPSLDVVMDRVARDAPLVHVFEALATHIDNVVGADGCWIVTWRREVQQVWGTRPLPFDVGLLRGRRWSTERFELPSGPDEGRLVVGYPILGSDRVGTAGVLVVQLPNVLVPLGSDGTLVTAAQLAALALSVTQRTERLRRAAAVDSLTGLANRRQFDEWIESIIGACGVLVADVDGLKPINDHYGHPVGDLVLREVGRRLGQSVRSGDRVARIGGDEFVILCADAADELHMERVVGRVRAGFAAPVILDDIALPVSLSIGTARRAANEPLGDAIERADRALYAQKRLRRSSNRGPRQRPR